MIDLGGVLVLLIIIGALFGLRWLYQRDKAQALTQNSPFALNASTSLPEARAMRQDQAKLLEAVRIFTDIKTRDEIMPSLSPKDRDDVEEFLADFFQTTNRKKNK